MSSFERQPSRHWSAIETDGAPQTAIIRNTTQYEPHLVDLVHATQHAKDLRLNVRIPRIYLQAASVDSAKIVGHGASFTASVRSLPPGPEKVETTVDMGGWTVTSSKPAPPTPKHILYKTARIAFSDAGSPRFEYKRAFQSFLTEVHALTHPSLFRHPNIIAFLGLAWGTNEFNVHHRLPALMLEYAEHDTLVTLLNRGSVPSLLAQSLCFDVASALQCIHASGLVHGDIKAENVLICQGAQRMVAKLGDFGYSIVGETEQEIAFVGGTRPWTAPETKGLIPVENLCYTDVYSLGLLIWTVCTGGENPFNLILDEPSEPKIEALKNSDGLLVASDTRTWIPKMLLRSSRYSVDRQQGDIHSIMSTAPIAADTDAQPTLSTTLAQEEDMNQLLSRLNQDRRQSHPFTALQLQQGVTFLIGRDMLLSRLNEIFSHSLGCDPLSRNLASIIDILQRGVAPAEPHITREGRVAGKTEYRVTNTSQITRSFIGSFGKDSSKNNNAETSHSRTDAWKTGKVADTTLAREHIETAAAAPHRDLAMDPFSEPSQVSVTQQLSWLSRGYKSSWHNWQVSWQPMRDLTPSMQELFYESLEQMVQPDSKILHVAATLNGYGCQRDLDKGLKLLRECAATSLPFARAYLYRVHKACGVSEVSDCDLTQYLDPMARIGSRAALLDLTEAGLFEKARNAARWVSERLGGVGAAWFADVNMLHGLTLGSWLDSEFLKQQVKQLDDINTYKINKHGDTLLHMLASCAQHDPRKFLVEELSADVNCRNSAGDTPLISICRAGVGASAIVFLQRYNADASLAAYNGETALHWLVSFPDDAIEPLTKDLIKQGAIVDAATTQNVNHSHFPGTVDFDFQLPGTPLQWAVHHNRPLIVATLLRHGANPELRSPGGLLSPLCWAAYFHYAECLQLMIDHLEQQHGRSDSAHNTDDRRALFYGPVLCAAIHSADTFSMMLRNGSKYLSQLRATLRILQDKTRLINLTVNFVEEGMTPLYYAVAEAHDEVVQCMLDNRWRLADLNKTCGDAMRTPLLEAVRWNRLPMIELLVKHGADIHARACNPFDSSVRDWSALHVLAEEGFFNCADTMTYLIQSGLQVDGVLEQPGNTAPSTLQKLTLDDADTADKTEVRWGETAFSCALRSNAFGLCNELLRLGADPNALSTTAGLFTVVHPATVLGHVIISNARHSYERLKHLLSLEQVSFEVVPAQGLTALHRAAMGCAGISSVDGLPVHPEEFGWDANQAIMRQLIARYGSPEELNARCLRHGRTALHLAVEFGNVGAVRILLDKAADVMVADDGGRFPGDLLDSFPTQYHRGRELISALNLPRAMQEGA